MSPVIATVRPGRDSPITCSGRTGPALPSTSSPRCRAAKAGPSAHAEPLRRLGVEAAGPLLLDQGVAVGAHAVLDREGLDLGALVGDGVAGVDFDQVEL